MFHVKHINPRYSDKIRETLVMRAVKHRKHKAFCMISPQYIVAIIDFLISNKE